MLHRTVYTALALAALGGVPLAAQDTTTVKKDTAAVVEPAAAPAAVSKPAPDTVTGTVVRPGMREAEVRARWGDPVAIRTESDWTYMFFRNHRERSVGTYDVVFLQSGQVMDAVVRSPDHVYAGQSSSPEGRVPAFTAPQVPADSSRGAAVTGVRVKPSP
jgi:hypothetical protein